MRLKIINKHILQTGMELYFILSCNVYSIDHHSNYGSNFSATKMSFSPFDRHSSYLRPFNLNDLNTLIYIRSYLGFFY